jgi:hypothetical protein
MNYRMLRRRIGMVMLCTPFALIIGFSLFILFAKIGWNALWILGGSAFFVGWVYLGAKWATD